jgi:hypothetical protein
MVRRMKNNTLTNNNDYKAKILIYYNTQYSNKDIVIVSILQQVINIDKKFVQSLFYE